MLVTHATHVIVAIYGMDFLFYEGHELTYYKRPQIRRLNPCASAIGLEDMLHG
jgi:hypothetical protein